MIFSTAELDWMEEAVAAMAEAGAWLEPEVLDGLNAEDVKAEPTDL
jgi:hypothetical protein